MNYYNVEQDCTTEFHIGAIHGSKRPIANTPEDSALPVMLAVSNIEDYNEKVLASACTG